MKKIYLFLLFTICSLAFSQSTKEKIQSYLQLNLNKLELSNSDINNWIVQSEASSTNTNITNYYIKQRYQEIEIYNAISNVWVKNNEVINVENQFVSNINNKVNTTLPIVSVIDGLHIAKNLLNIDDSVNHEILENKNNINFIISNAESLDQVYAKLVFQLTTDNSLRLAWDYTIDIPGHQHLWSVRIDAVNGKLLEKYDMVISCNFEHINNCNSTASSKTIAFNKSFYKDQVSSILEVQSGTYNVIPFNIESPNHGPRQLIVSPHNVTASPFGWHDTNGVTGNEYTFTRGNNVLAQDDLNGNNGNGTTANGGATLNFNFPYDGTATQPLEYLNAAITNLFYMNNSMHDVWYMQGFNELSGNFQQNNYARGGTTSATGDAVFADAQDGSTLNPQNLNNANFATPVDGQSPRMQMFLWNVAPASEPIYINTPIDIQGPRAARDNIFSPGHIDIPINPDLIEADFVLFDDGTPDIGQTDNADACGTAVNASEISDKIAVIRRSTSVANGGTPCSFIDKVLNAQYAGALAVIIVNNVDGAISMSGANQLVGIPAISVTKVVGDALIARMKIETVNGKIQLNSSPFVNSDGDFDNGIIAHEYGHGISNRLTGGAANSSCLNNAEQMGEGWSDWFALMMQLKAGDNGATPKGIGTFAISQATTNGGIRSFPYSTDMAVNPLTFVDSNDTESHNRGEFMATVLWDLTWAYIGKYGFSSNVFTGNAGNNKVMKLVIDGLKLQPCSPTFIDFRTAIIAADQATTSGQDYCMITEVFRRRGAGLNASSGSRTSATDQVENFTAFAPGPNCTLGIDYFQNEDLITVYPNPTKGFVTISMNQFIGKINIQIIDINGRIVSDMKNIDFNQQKEIDLSNFQSGVYILKINSESVNVTKKIILN